MIRNLVKLFFAVRGLRQVSGRGGGRFGKAGLLLGLARTVMGGKKAAGTRRPRGDRRY